MGPGPALTLYTARASALLYAGALALLLLGRKRDWLARIVWTVGCATLWLHVAAAFHFYHHWSHAEALRFTAAQSARLTGIRAGAGIYLNYLLMLVWAADCAWWWIAGPAGYRMRRRAIALTVHGYLLFMMFNAAVVFASQPTRAIGCVAVAALASVALAGRLPAHPGRPGAQPQIGEPRD